MQQHSICKCPGVRAQAAAKAAAIDRDRVLGTKVEILDASGQVLFSDCHLAGDTR